MAKEDVHCVLAGSEGVPASMEPVWGEVVNAAEGLEAALVEPRRHGGVGRYRRGLRGFVLLLCAEPSTTGHGMRRK